MAGTQQVGSMKKSPGWVRKLQGGRAGKVEAQRSGESGKIGHPIPAV